MKESATSLRHFVFTYVIKSTRSHRSPHCVHHHLIERTRLLVQRDAFGARCSSSHLYIRIVERLHHRERGTEGNNEEAAAGNRFTWFDFSSAKSWIFSPGYQAQELEIQLLKKKLDCLYRAILQPDSEDVETIAKEFLSGKNWIKKERKKKKEQLLEEERKKKQEESIREVILLDAKG